VEGKGRKGEDPITPPPDQMKILHLSVAQDTFQGKQAGTLNVSKSPHKLARIVNRSFSLLSSSLLHELFFSFAKIFGRNASKCGKMVAFLANLRYTYLVRWKARRIDTQIEERRS
jgi:hypothetical protein